MGFHEIYILVHITSFCFMKPGFTEKIILIIIEIYTYMWTFLPYFISNDDSWLVL